MDNNALITYKDVSTTDILKNPNDFLDSTLRQLLLQTEIDPNPLPREVIFSGKGERLSHRDAHIVIQKLLKDGYVGALTDKEWYYITFDGAKFITNGGYTTAFGKEKYQKRIQNLNNYLLIVGAWIAAFGSLGLLFSEYVKLTHHHPFGLKFWQIALGISTLLIPILSILRLPKLSNK